MSVDKLITQLKIRSKGCEFTKEELIPESMLRDRIVCGVQRQEVRRKMLDLGGKLTLEEAIQIARTHKTTRSQLVEMKATGGGALRNTSTRCPKEDQEADSGREAEEEDYQRGREGASSAANRTTTRTQRGTLQEGSSATSAES